MRPSLALALAAACASAACGAADHRARQPAPLPADAYAHYLHGKLALFEGDHPAAVRHLAAARAAAPGEAPIAVAHVDALARAGRPDRARRAAARAQRRWPRHPDVWLAAGHLHARLGDDRAARHAFERAIALAPDLEPAYLGLADAWVRLRRPDRAEATYRALLARAPDSTDGNYRLALRLAGRGAHAPAARHLSRLLDLEPDHLDARVALSRSLRALGRHREAVASLRLAFDRSRGDPRVGEQLVVQLLEAGDRESAIALLAQLDRDDLAAGDRLSLGDRYLQIGEPTRAEAVADAVLAADRAGDPGSGAARLLKARALAARGRAEQAVDILLGVPADRGSYAACRALAAELLARAGHGRRALGAIDQALAAAPGDARLLAGRARVHELAGDPARARRVFRRAVREPAAAASTGAGAPVRPPDVRLLYAWGAFEDRQGHPDRAIALMRRILRAHPDHAGALSFIGYSLADRGIDLPRARRLLERALARAPDDGHVLDSYGWLLFRQGRLADAERVLSRAARLLPTEPGVLWHLAEVHLARRDRGRALELLLRARSYRPEARARARIDARIRALGGGK